MNKVTLIGRAASAPLIKQTIEGETARFNIGIEDVINGIPVTAWYPVVCSGKAFSLACNHVTQGSSLAIEGKLICTLPNLIIEVQVIELMILT